MEQMMESFSQLDYKNNHPTVAKLHHESHQANYQLRHNQDSGHHYLHDKKDGELMSTFHNMSTDEVLNQLKKNGYADGHKAY
jgi:hypothetical protein